MAGRCPPSRRGPLPSQVRVQRHSEGAPPQVRLCAAEQFVCLGRWVWDLRGRGTVDHWGASLAHPGHPRHRQTGPLAGAASAPPAQCGGGPASSGRRGARGRGGCRARPRPSQAGVWAPTAQLPIPGFIAMQASMACGGGSHASANIHGPDTRIRIHRCMSEICIRIHIRTHRCMLKLCTQPMHAQ